MDKALSLAAKLLLISAGGLAVVAGPMAAEIDQPFAGLLLSHVVFQAFDRVAVPRDDVNGCCTGGHHMSPG